MNILYSVLIVASLPRLFTVLTMGGSIIQIMLLVFIVNLAFNSKVTKRGVGAVIVIVLYCVFEMYGDSIGLVRVDLKAVSLFLLTMLALLISSNKIIDEKNLYRFIVYSVLTVPISILMVFFSDLGLPIHAANGSEVFGFHQLTYFFSEPSHYAIFLALCLSIAIQLKVSFIYQITLVLGLIFTWSTSGFVLVSVLLVQSVFIKKAFHYIILFLILCILFAMLLYINFQIIDDANHFIVSHKIKTLLDYADGSVKATSASVRMFSTFLGPIYVFEQFVNEAYFNLLFGEGIGSPGDWIYMQFQNNFIDKAMERTVSYNFLSSTLIFGGILGLIIHFMVFFSCAWPFLSQRLYVFKYIVSILTLSMISGYAYGILAFLFFSLIIINASVNSRVFPNRMVFK